MTGWWIAAWAPLCQSRSAAAAGLERSFLFAGATLLGLASAWRVGIGSQPHMGGADSRL